MKPRPCLVLVLALLPGCLTPETELGEPQIANETSEDGYFYTVRGTLANNTGDETDLWVICDVFTHGEKAGQAHDTVHLPPEGSAPYEVAGFSRGPIDRADCRTSSTPPR
jgi:hypothetical protein